MENTNFQLILTEPNGNSAIPDITITSDFETTFSIQNAADISQRKDSISKNITFPGTKNNNRIFNNLYSFNRASDSSLEEVLFYNYSPNVGIKAILYENTYPIFTGMLKINEVAKDENGAFTFVGVITGNLVNFFSNIKDKLLADLPGFNLEQTYSIDNIIASWPFDASAKFLYPMIDYGKGQVPRRDKFDIRNLRPAIYLRYYIAAILSSQGYKYKSEFIDGFIFSRIFVPFSDAEFGRIVFGDTLTVATYSGETIYSDYSVSLDIRFDFASVRYGAVPYNTFMNIQRNVSVMLHSDNSALRDRSRSADIFTFIKYSSTSVKITVSFTAYREDTSGDMLFRIGLYRVNNGVITFEQALDYRDYKIGGDGAFSDTVTFNLPYGDYEKGYMFGVFTPTINGYRVHFTQHSVSMVVGDPDPARGSFFAYDPGDTFNLTDAIPKNQKAVDFLKSILKVFNLYMIENPDNDRELIIEPYDTFYNQAINPVPYALNWTKKVDQKTLKIKINTALPKAYDFRFKADTDYYNTLYKNTYNANYGDLIVQNKNGSADTKVIEADFSPTVVVQETGDDKTIPAIFTGEINNKKSFKSNLRLLFNNGTRNCANYDISNITNGNYNVLKNFNSDYQQSHTILNSIGVDYMNLLFGLPLAVYYPVTGSIFDVPTIFDEMYANQLAEINDDNIFTLELDVHLTDADIANLNLRKPIFVSTVQGDAYFKIMSVTYYNREEVSKVVFQKIII